jgi:hypothetical protein
MVLVQVLVVQSCRMVWELQYKQLQSDIHAQVWEVYLRAPKPPGPPGGPALDERSIAAVTLSMKSCTLSLPIPGRKRAMSVQAVSLDRLWVPTRIVVLDVY